MMDSLQSTKHVEKLIIKNIIGQVNDEVLPINK